MSASETIDERDSNDIANKAIRVGSRKSEVRNLNEIYICTIICMLALLLLLFVMELCLAASDENVLK